MRLLICGGGTGGHLFPGVAVAEEFLHSVPRAQVLFVHTGRETDKRVLAKRNFASQGLVSAGLKGKSWWGKVKALLMVPGSVWQAMRLIKEFRPQVVLGVGGYVTGPVLLGAWILGIPVCIHEQNSVPGLANRLLSHLARRIFLSIPGSEGYFRADRWVFTGNPVRKEVRALAGGESRGKGKTLVVMGGSLGAHALNLLMAEGARMLRRQVPEDFRIIHQTGRADVRLVSTAYEKMRIPAKVRAFFDNMPMVLAKADLVVARAGATSLAELTVMGKAMILVPYPYAADDHQMKNGRWLAEAGAATLCEQQGLSSKMLTDEIVRLINNDEERLAMAHAARKLGKPTAARIIVEECLKMAVGEEDKA